MTTAASGFPDKRMKLRYAGACQCCHTALPAATLAVYDRAKKNVSCLPCADRASHAEAGVLVPAAADDPKRVSPPPAPCRDAPAPDVTPAPPDDQSVVITGTPGGSAQREYERRKAKRENRVREAHPRMAGLLLALSDDPQSTRAWRTGAVGEQQLGRRLDSLVGQGVQVLHDRRIPGSRANLDHLVVGPAGVFVLDAKCYRGLRPARRVEGGFLRPRLENLFVGRHDRTKLVDGLRKQVALVRTALERGGLTNLPVRGMLCFVDANWPLIGGSFRIDEFDVLSPSVATKLLVRPGPIEPAEVEAIHRLLALAFPSA